MNRRQFVCGALTVGIGALTGACAVYHEPRHGPPSHAPAHGYRYRHPHGVNLVWDAGIGVYAVVGRPNYYFLDGRYYRRYRDYWQVSPRLDGRWTRYDHDRVPPGLRRKWGRDDPPGRGRGRGRDRDR